MRHRHDSGASDATSPEINHRAQTDIASREGLGALFFYGISMGYAVLSCTERHDASRDGFTVDASSPDLATDSGASNSSDWVPDPAFDAGQTALGVGLDACAAEDSPPLAMIPESFTVFQREGSSCQPLGSGVLFRNTGPGPLRIDGVEASAPEFSLVAGSFPVNLEPGAFLPLRVHYRGIQNGAVEAGLTFATAEGCREYRLHGLRVADSMISRTDEALDFGRVGARAVSASRRLSVRTETAAGATVIHHAFGADPPDLFEIVAATIPGTEATACETRDVDVRFHAPAKPGAFEGALLWRASISTPAGEAEATMFVPLYATVTDDPL